MRSFLIVFKHEFKEQFRKKAVVVTTLVLMIICFTVAAIPRFQALIGGAKPAISPKTAVFEKAGYCFADEGLHSKIKALTGFAEDAVYPDRAALVAALKEGKIKLGFSFTAPTGFETLYQDRGIGDTQDQKMEELVIGDQKARLFAEKGVKLEEIRAIENLKADSRVSVLGKNSGSAMAFTMVLVILLYMLILIFGATTATAIAREKDSRAMELLITSAKPQALVLGKVAATGLASFLQLLMMVAAAAAGIALNFSYYPPFLKWMIQNSFEVDYLMSYLFFGLIGYTLYLFLFAALGSTVSRIEDVNSVTSPVQFLVIAGYMIAFSVTSDPNSVLAVAGSLIPFTAPFVMPLRVALVTVPWTQLLISGALLLLSCAVLSFISIKIYRWGTLNYGNKLKLFRNIGQALRYKG